MRLPVHKYLAIAFSFLLLPFFQPAIAHAGADDNQDLHKIEEILARFAKIYKGKPTGGCWWEPTRGTTEDETELFQFLKRLDGGVLQNHAIHTTSSQLQYTNLETGKTKGLNIRQCWGDQANSPQVGDKLYDEVGPPNPSVLLPSLYDRAVGTIYDPVPDMSPTTDMYINLGLWMAVEPLDPHPLVVRAEIPGAWAQVTATAISTTFDMGNGDTVVCNKHHGGVFGTPIPESKMDTIEEGPCGYTYYTVDDLGDKTITITTTWKIEEETSVGFYRRRADITLTTEHPISVWEITTRGGNL